MTTSCNECGLFNRAPGSKLTFREKTFFMLHTNTCLLVYVYVLTRVAFLPCSEKDEAIASLSKCGIPDEALLYHDQSKCQFC